ncbi:MAG: DegT/DnrJ/EryC1/StrS family aminotransferase [Blastocatellia bacterium]
MTIPLLDLQAQHKPIQDEMKAAMSRVLDSGTFILGPEVAALEAEIAAYSQCEFGIGVSSGTDALLIALMAIDIQPGDEVITTPFSFFATAGSIARLGAKAVFVDIEPESFNLDPIKVAAAITPRTRAIMPVHLYGQMAEMEPLMELAAQYRLTVIEDAAQAIGAEYKGRRAGSVGQMGCFSFYPSKNLGAPGDAGMVVTNDATLAARLRALRNHGSLTTKYYHQLLGGNFRIDALQAAVLRVKLKYLDAWTAERQRNAALYRSLWPSASSVQLPVALPARRHVYNQFVVRTPQREEVIARLQAAKIGYDIYYPVALHTQECLADLGYQHGDFPIAEAAAEQVLALPIYAELTPEQIASIVHAVNAVPLANAEG